ncbi:S41 family peptidase [uncultured Croceitalea sp.]|uniref:S41 family peptidase n=1 Tax=uncultured Croceitalea sp. TaxID=1798908 RepID=UPI003305F4BB
MKSLFLSIAACFFLFTTSTIGQEQRLTVKDSITALYTKLFEELQENYLHTKAVDWPAIKSCTMKEVLKSGTLEESLKHSTKLFDTIKGNHLILFSEKNWYNSTLGKPLTAELFNKSVLDAYEKNKPFETKVIHKNYGYVFIPGMLLKDATRQQRDEAAQKIYDAIVEIDKSHNIKGWIVDLRLNVGGNSNVMLTGLYHLLGNGTTHLVLNIDKHVKTLTGLHEGVMYKNHKENHAVTITTKPKPQIPVALLSGVLTNSAGEFVILGFRGRKNTIVIGEESLGNTTANDLYEMPFGIKAAITESYGTDRSAKFTKTIVPDIEVIKQTNFEDLSKDKNVIEAIRFIDSY